MVSIDWQQYEDELMEDTFRENMLKRTNGCAKKATEP